MMKDEFKISALNANDAEIETISEFHKQIVEDTRLEGDLIYFDSNFPRYLRKIIEGSEGHRLFKLQKSNELHGFGHCIISETMVFLNNIFICEEFRGQGLGKRFLHQILICVTNESIQKFTLDVFYSNQVALRWYERMGLAIIGKTNWYEISANDFASRCREKDLNLRKDKNGFNCFYSEDNKLGTVVNTTLIVNNLLYIHCLPLTQFKRIVSKENFEDVPRGLNVRKIETSVRMQGDFKEVLKNLEG